MDDLLCVTKRFTAFVLCAVMLLSPVCVSAEDSVSAHASEASAWAENALPAQDPVATVTKKTCYKLLAGGSEPVYNDRYVIVHNATNSILTYDAISKVSGQSAPNTPASMSTGTLADADAGLVEAYFDAAVSESGNPLYLYMGHHYRDAAMWILLQTKSEAYGTASIGNNTALSTLNNGAAVPTYLGGTARYHHTWLSKGNGPTLNADGTVAATNNGAYWYSTKGNDAEGKQWRFLRLDEADLFGIKKNNTQIEKFPDDTYLIYYQSSTAYHVLCRNEDGTWGCRAMTPAQVAAELENLKVRLYEYSYTSGYRNLSIQGMRDFYFLANHTNEEAMAFIARNIRVTDTDCRNTSVGCSGTVPKIGCYWLDGQYDSATDSVITIKYHNDNGTDTVIGTVNAHIVQEVPLGITVSATSGAVAEGTSGDAVVSGCVIKRTVNTVSGVQETQIPVLLEMLTDSRGNAVDSTIPGSYTGLTLTYEGVAVTTDFCLTVIKNDAEQPLIRCDSDTASSGRVLTADSQRYYLLDKYIDPNDHNDRYMIVDHKSNAIMGYSPVVDVPNAEPNPTFTLDAGVLNGEKFYIPFDQRDAALWIFQGRTDGFKISSTAGLYEMQDAYRFITLGSEYPAYRNVCFYKGLGPDFNEDGTVESNNGYYWHSVEGAKRTAYDGVTQHRFMRLYDGAPLFHTSTSPNAFRLCIESFGDGTFLIYRANRNGTSSDHTDDIFYVLCHGVDGMSDFGGGWGYRQFNGSAEFMAADLDSLKLRLYKLHGGEDRYVRYSGSQNYYVTGSCDEAPSEAEVLAYIAANIQVTASNADGAEDPYSTVSYDPARTPSHYYLEFDTPYDASITRATSSYAVSIKYRNDNRTDTLVGTVHVYIEDSALSAPLNLMDFGAAGDGSADDHTALQAAIDAAAEGQGNGVIHIPAGTYRMDDFVILKSNITIQMDDNATIVNNICFSSGPSMIFLTGPFTRGAAKQMWEGVENVTIIGGTIDMNGELNEAGDGMKNKPDGSGSSAFALGYSRNVRIENVTFLDNYAGHAMQICACDGVVIKDCVFKGQSFPNTLTSKQMDNKELVQIEPSTVKGFPYAANNTGEASRNITIENCYFGASEVSGEPSVAIGTHNQVLMGKKCHNIQIRNNVFDNMRYAGVRFCGYEDVTIQGNTFIKKTQAQSVNYRADGSYLINLYCYNNTTDALDPNKRITIDNNVFRIADPVTRAIRAAKDNEAYLGEVTDIAITNNTIYNTSADSKDIGIQALRISDGLTITGNTINGGYRGIEVQYCAGDITINTNQMSGLAYQHFRFISCGSRQTIYFYTHGNGTMDVSTANGTYTMTAVPNAGCTFAGYYKQNALTTLVSTESVQQIPVNQASKLYRHPLFEG